MVYIEYLKVKIIAGLQYKVAAISGLMTQIFWGFMHILMYIAFYSHTNITSISLEQLVTYTWLTQSFLALIYINVKDNEIIDSINDGTVAYELARPYNLYVWWYVKILANKVASCILRFAPIIILGFLLPKPYNLALPNSLLSFVLFIITLILGTLLLCGIIMITHTISFFTINPDGINNIICNVIALLSGFVLPLALFPNIFIKLTYYLPFRLIGDLPFRVYSGNIGVNEALIDILMQGIWIVIIIMIGYFLMRKALKKVFIQGG